MNGYRKFQHPAVGLRQTHQCLQPGDIRGQCRGRNGTPPPLSLRILLAQLRPDRLRIEVAFSGFEPRLQAEARRHRIIVEALRHDE